MSDPVATSLTLAVRYLTKRATDPAAACILADQLAQQIVEVAQQSLDARPIHVPLSLGIELERLVGLAFAAEIQGTSPDTLERENAKRVAAGQPSQIIKLSKRRKAMRLKHALMLG